MPAQKPESALEAATLQQYGYLATEYRGLAKILYEEKIKELELSLKTCEQFAAQEISSVIETLKELSSKIP